jgi:hypothetical protein
MWCPECEAEYRAGIVTCADCGRELVADLEAGRADDDRPSLLPVARTQDPDELERLVGLLEGAEIPYFLQAGTALGALVDPAVDLRTPQPWEARLWIPGSYAARLADLRRQAEWPAPQPAPESASGAANEPIDPAAFDGAIRPR